LADEKGKEKVKLILKIKKALGFAPLLPAATSRSSASQMTVAQICAFFMNKNCREVGGKNTDRRATLPSSRKHNV